MRIKGQPPTRTRSFSRVDRAMPVYSAASQVRSIRRFEDDLNEGMSYPSESPETPGYWVGLKATSGVAHVVSYATPARSLDLMEVDCLFRQRISPPPRLPA